MNISMRVLASLVVALSGNTLAYISFTAKRSSLYKIGKTHGFSSRKSRKIEASLRMEDFGLFKGMGAIDYEDIWNDEFCISEVGLEKRLNKDEIRYKMNRTRKEAEKVGKLGNLPFVQLNLPFFGKVYLGPPSVESVWEALGFTATSNNEARQKEKLKAIEKARGSPTGVMGGAGADSRQKYLEKYGYPRLDGTGGIFYADQLSTDKVPMGGFNMGKGGSIWPVPDAVSNGQYGKTGRASVDGLKKVKKNEK
jgi:hypothetical protein